MEWTKLSRVLRVVEVAYVLFAVHVKNNSFFFYNNTCITVQDLNLDTKNSKYIDYRRLKKRITLTYSKNWVILSRLQLDQDQGFVSKLSDGAMRRWSPLLRLHGLLSPSWGRLKLRGNKIFCFLNTETNKKTKNMSWESSRHFATSLNVGCFLATNRTEEMQLNNFNLKRENV